MAEPGAPDQLRAAGERIDALLDAASSGGVVARERAEELVRIVADLYGAGLERLLDIAYEAGRLDDELLAALAKDDLVASLLLVHGLHPYDVAVRVEQALEGVRPYLGSHGGDVELLEVSDEGVVRLQLLGSCDGCPSSSVTLQLAVEGAIEAAAPEVTRIEVKEATTAGNGETLISVDSLRSRIDDGRVVEPVETAASWERLREIDNLADGAVTRVEISDADVMVCRIGSTLFAFLDRCARCEASLEGAVLARRLGAAVGEAVLRCPTCRAHFDVRRAGAGLDDEALHLTPLPLLTDGGVTSIAIPSVAGA